MEGVGGRAGPGAGGAGQQPGRGAGVVSAGRAVRGRPGRGRRPDVSDLDLADGPLVLVVGSEGRGLSRLVAQRCDMLARIPMPGPAESLNAGVAAGIALYEVARRRGAESA